METLELQITEKNNIEISQNDFFRIDTYKKRLTLELQKIENGESKLYNIEELDAMLEKTISKYEG